MKNPASYIFRLSLLILAAVSLAGTFFWSYKGARYYSVQSDSMAPELLVGDLVIDERPDIGNLNAGDVISYINPADSKKVITHKIINIDSSKALVTTRGDNLVSPDPPVAFNMVLGKKKAAIPYLGYFMDALKTPLGIAALVYVPILIIALAELRTLAGRFGQPYKHAKLY